MYHAQEIIYTWLATVTMDAPYVRVAQVKPPGRVEAVDGGEEENAVCHSVPELGNVERNLQKY
jgi:hypothetical protein